MLQGDEAAMAKLQSDLIMMTPEVGEVPCQNRSEGFTENLLSFNPLHDPRLKVTPSQGSGRGAGSHSVAATGGSFRHAADLFHRPLVPSGKSLPTKAARNSRGRSRSQRPQHLPQGLKKTSEEGPVPKKAAAKLVWISIPIPRLPRQHTPRGQSPKKTERRTPRQAVVKPKLRPGEFPKGPRSTEARKPKKAARIPCLAFSRALAARRQRSQTPRRNVTHNY